MLDAEASDSGPSAVQVLQMRRLYKYEYTASKDWFFRHWSKFSRGVWLIYPAPEADPQQQTHLQFFPEFDFLVAMVEFFKPPHGIRHCCCWLWAHG